MTACSIAFPKLSDDPLEQLLIAEAVMTRHHYDTQLEHDHEARRQAAREHAQQLLAARRT